MSQPAREGLEQLLAAVDTELEHLSGRIHEGPVQALVAARLMLDLAARGRLPGAVAVDPETLTSALAPLRQAVTDAVTGLRQLMGASRERPDPADFAATVQAARDLAALAGLTVTGRDGPGRPCLDEAPGRALHRLLQAEIERAELSSRTGGPRELDVTWGVLAGVAFVALAVPPVDPELELRPDPAPLGQRRELAREAGIVIHPVLLGPRPVDAADTTPEKWLITRMDVPT